MLLSVLKNKSGAARDVVILNAGAAIYVAGVVDNLAAGITTAQKTIESGAALKKLHELVVLSQKNAAQ